MKTVKQQIIDAYNEPFNGHPSREDIKKLEKAIMIIAERVDLILTAIDKPFTKDK